MNWQAKDFYEFGPFRIDVQERLLLRGAEAVPLTAKAFDMLLVLVEHRGRLLEKDELMRRVWPDSFVEEANLSHSVHTLRKALGEGKDENQYIQTVPRRGYRFVARVSEVRGERVETAVKEGPLPPQGMEATEDSVNSDGSNRPAPAIPTTNPPVKTDAARRPKTLLVAALVAAACLGLVIYFFTFGWPQPGPSSLPVKSIAVLPFRQLDRKADDEYLGLGLADALITRLSNVKGVVVRPTSAILKYDNAELRPTDAGAEQRVESLLEGAIQRSGDRIRVSVQLVRVGDGVPLWAGNFDENFTDLFKVQDSISEQVTRALMLNLTGEEQGLIKKRYTADAEAQRLYMKGRFHWSKFNEQGLTKAIEYFNQALELDPNYALAYVGLSIAYSVQGAIGALPPREVRQKAKAMAEKAIALDGDLPEAHLSLGAVSLVYGRDWSGAEKELKRAIELNPNYGEAYNLYSYYLQATGRAAEAVTEARRAQDLDPLSPSISSDLGFAFYYARQYDEAITAYWKAKELDPKLLGSQFLLGLAYAQKEAYGEGIAECQKEMASAGRDPRILFSLAYLYARSRQEAAAEKLAAELTAAWEQRYFPPFLMAILYAGLEDRDRAFAWLDKAYDADDPQLIWVKVEPALDGLHSDHRFQALLQRMGLAGYE